MPLGVYFRHKGTGRSTTRARWATWVPAGSQKKSEKKLTTVKEAGNADCVHGQGITIFARDRPRLCVSSR